MSVLVYRNKEGQIIDVAEWMRLFEDHAYKVVEQSTTPSGLYWVSSVWTGMSATGHIFESMVCRYTSNKQAPANWVDQARYNTLEETLAGHKELLEKWNGPLADVVSRLRGDEA